MSLCGRIFHGVSHKWQSGPFASAISRPKHENMTDYSYSIGLHVFLLRISLARGRGGGGVTRRLKWYPLSSEIYCRLVRKKIGTTSKFKLYTSLSITCARLFIATPQTSMTSAPNLFKQYQTKSCDEIIISK